MTDIEIARKAKLETIDKIAEKLDISEENLEMYGKYKAKISNDLYMKRKDEKNGKLVLVTAMSPTPLGEGKTTVSIAIADGLRKIKEKSIVHKDTLRAFHDEIYARYKEVLSGDKNALYKMKEFWFYMIHSFEDSEKYAKRIRKSKSAAEYEGIIVSLFNELDIAGDNERGFSLIK